MAFLSRLRAGLAAVIAAGAVIVSVLGAGAARALPPVTLGGTCVFTQSASGLTLTANCAPTSSIVIPPSLRLNGNGRTINGTGLGAGVPVITTTPGSPGNQVLGATVLVGTNGYGIYFDHAAGLITGNVVDVQGTSSANAIIVLGGTASVQSNTIRNLGPGSYGVVAVNATVQVTSNRITGIGPNPYATGIAVNGGNGVVLSNTIEGVESGVFAIQAPGSSFRSNIVHNVRVGFGYVASYGVAGNLTFASNDIEATEGGIKVSGCYGAAVDNVTITHNAIRRVGQAQNGRGITASTQFGYFSFCGDGTMNGLAVTWNTLVGWSNTTPPANPDRAPYEIDGPTNVVMKYNTVIP